MADLQNRAKAVGLALLKSNQCSTMGFNQAITFRHS